MTCCDYGCTRAPNCPAGSKDSMPYEFWPGSIVAEKLLAGERLPELVPLYNHLHTENSDGSDPEADEVEAPDWEAIAIVGGALILFLASVVGISMAVLHFWR